MHKHHGHDHGTKWQGTVRIVEVTRQERNFYFTSLEF